MKCGKDPNAQSNAHAAASPGPASASRDDTLKDKCYALCKQPKKTPKCGRCTHKQQCAEGFCCPFVKLCLVKGGTKDKCGNYQKLAANCNGCGKTASNPEDPTCKCSNKDWPQNWLGKCNNGVGDQWVQMCGSYIESPRMK